MLHAIGLSLLCMCDRRPAPRSPEGGAPATVEIVQLAGGAVIQPGAGAYLAELGTVSANAPPTAAGIRIERRPGGYAVVTEIGLRVEGALVSRFVALQASLDAGLPPGVTVRLDGITLSQIPRTIGSRVPAGAVTRHLLELDIPSRLNPATVPQEIPLELGATPE
jgi:hypothetical protein